MQVIIADFRIAVVVFKWAIYGGLQQIYVHSPLGMVLVAMSIKALCVWLIWSRVETFLCYFHHSKFLINWLIVFWGWFTSRWHYVVVSTFLSVPLTVVVSFLRSLRMSVEAKACIGSVRNSWGLWNAVCGWVYFWKKKEKKKKVFYFFFDMTSWQPYWCPKVIFPHPFPIPSGVGGDKTYKKNNNSNNNNSKN